MSSVRRLASLLGFALVFAAPMPAQSPSKASAPGELPLDLAFSRKTVRRWERPAVSANGQTLAFDVYTPPERSATSQLAEGVRYTPGGTPEACVGLRVHVVATAGGPERDACPEKGNCWRPSPSPDGKLVAYYSDAGGPPQLWVFDVASGKPRRVSDVAIKPKHWPGDEALWSADGREVIVPLRPKGQSFAEPATPKAVLPPAGAKLEKPTVLVYSTAGGKGAPVGAGGTPPSMMEHFIRENNVEIGAIDVASGKVRIVVPAEAEPRPSAARLSPDGKWISYLSVFKQKGETTSEVYYDLAVVPAAGGKPAMLAADVQTPYNDYFEATYRWIPGTARVVVMKDKKLWIVDAAAPASAPKPLGDSLGKLEEAPLLLTADGKSVLVGIEDEGEKTYYSVQAKALALVPIDGSAPKTLTVTGSPLDATRDALWQPDARRFAVVRNDEATGERSVDAVDAASGAVTTLWKGRGRLDAAGAGTGGELIARYESLDTPPDFYAFPPTFASKKRLSHVEPRLDKVSVGPLEMFTSSVPGYDGRLQTVTSAMFFPPGRTAGQKVPTIVYFYSGSQVGASAQDYGGGAPNSIPVQVFATRGYGVLLCDVPLGPQGKGGNPIQEMGDAILGQVYRSAGLGQTDVDRVAIMGQSYGGYSTAAMISQTNLFRGAIALDGLYDLSGEFARMGPGGSTFNFVWSETGQGRMGTHPWADLRRYLANSPYYQADKMHTPLLLIHGKNDDTCPVEGAERMYNALKRLDRTAELAIYDGEGHVPGDWSLVNAVDATQRMVDWFGKYVKDAGSKTGKEGASK